MATPTTDLFNLSLDDFAAEVHAAVRTIGTAAHERFGDRKVFVSALAIALGMGELDALWFHRRLLDAQTEGHLLLARADLVAAMDPEIVASSEISLEGCTWHFVIDRVSDPLAYAELAARAVKPDPYDRAKQVLASEAGRLRSGEGGHGGRSHAALELADAIDHVVAGPGVARGRIGGGR